jgi:hypothetical protein
VHVREEGAQNFAAASAVARQIQIERKEGQQKRGQHYVAKARRFAAAAAAAAASWEDDM